jgi:hypothetical protein
MQVATQPTTLFEDTMQSIPTANRSVLDAVAKQFDLSDARLQEISKKFVDELRLGLAQDSAGGLPMM